MTWYTEEGLNVECGTQWLDQAQASVSQVTGLGMHKYVHLYDKAKATFQIRHQVDAIFSPYFIQDQCDGQTKRRIVWR